MIVLNLFSATTQASHFPALEHLMVYSVSNAYYVLGKRPIPRLRCCIQQIATTTAPPQCYLRSGSRTASVVPFRQWRVFQCAPYSLVARDALRRHTEFDRERAAISRETCRKFPTIMVKWEKPSKLVKGNLKTIGPIFQLKAWLLVTQHRCYIVYVGPVMTNEILVFYICRKETWSWHKVSTDGTTDWYW